MCDQSLYDKIHGQFEMLLKGFPGPHRLRGFLEEVSIPPTVGPLLPSARSVAEMLMAAPSASLAIEELRADQDAARAFYQFAMAQFPTLRETLRATPALANKNDQPFYELSTWILSLIAQRLP